MRGARMHPAFLSLLSLLVGLGVAYLFIGGAPWESEFGTYWAATSLLMKGGNVYDAEALQNFCLEAGVSFTGPLHPPPFTTIILAPFTLFPFSTAAKLFFVFNLGATVLATWISTQLLMTDTKRCVVSVVPAAFLPTLLPILFGQTSTIVMTSVYAGTLLARRGR